MPSKFRLLLLFLFIQSAHLSAQTFSIQGKVTDSKDASELVGVSLVLSTPKDSSNKKMAISDAHGFFKFEGLSSGRYLLKASYLGFEAFTKFIKLEQSIAGLSVDMKSATTTLKNVTVTGQQIRTKQMGDTTTINANAYKTHPDATTEDLIGKMPGISTEGNMVKAHGEDVKRVLVDGKPFFGDDPNASIKNLPAEVVEKVQIFDKLSEQAQLTGFSDGQEEKTLNIITRPGRNNGQFGKIFGGIGALEKSNADALYQLGGNMNFFKGVRRISILGLVNNLNQLNFSSEDLMGVMGQSGGGGRGGMGGGRGMGGMSFGGGNFGGGGNNFLVGPQSGITTTKSFGINYSDEWMKKVQVSGSYFFNETDNNTLTNLTRNYFTGNEKSMLYKSYDTTNTFNINHRANLRIEYTIDSFNTVIFSPRISIQHTDYDKNLIGNTTLQDTNLVNVTHNKNASNSTAINFNGNLTYNHKFSKAGSSFSINLNAQDNGRTGNGSYYSLNQYHIDSLNKDTSITYDQQYDLNSKTKTYSTNLTYTEPLSKKAQLMVNYAPSSTISESDKATFRNNGNGTYNVHDTALSNKYNSNYTMQKGGVSYRYNELNLQLTVGFNYQNATLKGAQTYPLSYNTSRTFENILPNAMLNYKINKSKNIRVMYRASINAPSVSQLQNVYDISNPLLVKTGNTDLVQDYQHYFNVRYSNSNAEKNTNLMFMCFANYGENYIGNASYILRKDTTVGKGILLNKGAQLSLPVNLTGYWSARSFVSYGMPVKKLKSNLNMNAGIGYNRIPAIVNGWNNTSNNYSANGGFVFSSNISEALDFTLTYSGYYNMVENSVQTQSNTNYYNHNASFRFNYIHNKRIVFNSAITNNVYSGLSQGYDQNYWLWNAGIGYKFLKNKALDVRLNIYDLLNQNKAVNRTINETYIEDSYTNVLQQYFMLNITYTIRKFRGMMPNFNRPPEMREDMMPSMGQPPRWRKDD